MAHFYPRSSRRLPAEILTPTEIRKLLAACNQGATGARNQALIAVLWRGGLRIGEALALRTADPDPSAGVLRVSRGKGGRPRMVGLDPEAFAVLGRWQAVRDRLGIQGGRPLFCTLRGGALDSGYVRALFKRLGRAAGLSKRAHPHGLRHAYAVEALRDGIPLHVVQAQLGHADLGTTGIYLSHVTEAELASAAERRSPWDQR